MKLVLKLRPNRLRGYSDKIYPLMMMICHVIVYIVYYVNVLFVKQWWYFSILSIDNSPERSLYCLTKSVGPSQRVLVTYWYQTIDGDEVIAPPSGAAPVKSWG